MSQRSGQVARLRWAAASIITAIVFQLVRMARQRAAEHHLHALSERGLKDIGVPRGHIPYAAADLGPAGRRS